MALVDFWSPMRWMISSLWWTESTTLKFERSPAQWAVAWPTAPRTIFEFNEKQQWPRTYFLEYSKATRLRYANMMLPVLKIGHEVRAPIMAGCLQIWCKTGFHFPIDMDIKSLSKSRILWDNFNFVFVFCIGHSNVDTPTITFQWNGLYFPLY